MRTIFEFCAESAEIADWVAERGGFELPRPFRIEEEEFGPSLVHYSARIKASVLERICSKGDRPHQKGCSPSPQALTRLKMKESSQQSRKLKRVET